MTQAGPRQRARAKPELSVIVCAHNEAGYIESCLKALSTALMDESSEAILVADRCTDDTILIANRFPARIIEKTWKKWRNSYAEALQTGYQEAKGTKYLSIVDADVIVPPDFFRRLKVHLTAGVASVSSDLQVFPTQHAWNRIIYYWQRTYAIAPLGEKPWGACRLMQREAVDLVQGFKDTQTPDSDLDLRLAASGFRSIMARDVTAYHIRNIDLKKIITGQITSGQGRYKLGENLLHTTAHAVLRVRPFVVAGWLQESLRSKERH